MRTASLRCYVIPWRVGAAPRHLLPHNLGHTNSLDAPLPSPSERATVQMTTYLKQLKGNDGNELEKCGYIDGLIH